MASAALGKEPECSICQRLYTDSATLRCGHNFCRVCMEQVLNTQDESGVYSCPECRAEFQERPALKGNITLYNVVKNVRSTQPKQEDNQICCIYCVDFPVPAVKSCLMCEASLCDNHLKVHSKGAEHVLTEPSTSPENWKCSVHKKILEYYCTEDAACICVSCSLGTEHQNHRVELLEEISERKKKVSYVLQKLTTKREETEERVQSLEEQRRKAEEKASGEAERVTAQFIDIWRRLDDLEKRLPSKFFRQEELVSLSLSDVIQKLEKMDELSWKMRHIEELCNITNPLTVLQDPDLCDPEEKEGDEDTGEHDGGDKDSGGHVGGDGNKGGHDGGVEDTREHDGGDEDTGRHDGGDEDRVGHDGGDEDRGGHDGGDEDRGGHDGGDEDTGGHDGGDRGVEQISHISRTLSDVRRDINVTVYGQGPADILLDINTAAKYILISDDLKTATWTQIKQSRPKFANKFQYYQVMSRNRFSSGRHYWDVEISGSGWWRVGMCYPSIDRRGNQSYIGNNNKSWSLCGGWGISNQCSVRHDNKEIQLTHLISSDRVRVCLDYEAGQLSFYELCDPIRQLHTFTALFTEPLHAVLCVC